MTEALETQTTGSKPEEIALPPSRSTTLDVGIGGSVASPEELSSTARIEEETKEAEEAETESIPASSLPEAIKPLALGHNRLQSIATESTAETEEAATPPPRSITPSSADLEEEEGGTPLDTTDQDLMGNLQGF
jgi:hypothetical protein